MGCRTRKYSDGGKVLKSEYGEPTFTRSLLESVGVGDGYGNPKSSPKSKDKDADKRMSISNAPSKFSDVMRKRKEQLSEYADGGKVKKRKGC